ncbi:thioredoxin-like domain-containing protein [Pedobacter sp.]|uniref:thioredoxin-like domain-containing protein n=1 Tax=Pedobacter sp. TaxID=1411316 RepID=UPI003D7F6AE0
MKSKQIKLMIALFLSPLAAFTQAGDFTVEGKVNSKYNGAYVKLFYNQNETKFVDSVQIKKGSFKFNGNVALPALGTLSMKELEMGDRVPLFLSAGKIRVSTKDSLKNAQITGTKLAEDQAQFTRIMRKEDDILMAMIYKVKQMPEGAEKQGMGAPILKIVHHYTDFKIKAIQQFVTDHPNSYVSLYHLNNSAVGATMNYEATYPYYEKLSNEVKETPLGKQFGNRLLAVKGKMDGQPYIDFVSTTPEGKSLSLKEVINKNKYTLVDFWASWCGPCRNENPNVVKTYNDFKAAGFTVLSVSLDDNTEKWKAAIEKDGMPWYHVSSLKGWNEPAAKLYNVRAIPQNVLIDQNGKVVASNLRGETLYKKVQSLMK